MKSIASAQSLLSMGRFREALEAAPLFEAHRESVAARLLRAELLIEVGNTAASLSIIEAVETARGISDAERSQIEFVRSLIEKERGNFASEQHHLPKAISFAETAHAPA